MLQHWTAMDTHGFVFTLVFTIGAALIGATLAARLRQSVILGYLLAGVAIGPFTPGPVGDVPTIQALADVGVIFLMFAIGVQLSLRQLLEAGRLVIIGGGLQVCAVLGLGYVVAMAIGWRPLEAVFFGAVISISSGAVLTKLLDERAEGDTPHGRIALAWSAVQDVGTVLLMVVLAALAGGGSNLWGDVLWAGGKAALFLVLVGPVGAVALPWFFEHIAALRNREVFLLSIAAVALGTAYSATFFGLSIALGAFIAGMVVSESDLSHQILGEVMPLRDIFAGLFFVSVGMLVDPTFVVHHPALVLSAVALIVAAKAAITTVIMVVARQPARVAILTGVLLGQAGEFSFLLARLGADLGAVSPPAFSLMLAAAVASIVLSPILYQGVYALLPSIERRLSMRLEEGTGPASEAPLRGHAVLCGFGRVGRVIGTVLLRRGFRTVVIEQDLRLVRELRSHGVSAWLGSAANPVLLERASLAGARLLIVAIPDPLAARQIVDYARAVNQRLDIVVRTHSAQETVFMQRRGVSEVVMGETELALEMTRHALHRFGVSAPEIQAIVGRLRERVAQGAAPEELGLAE